MESVMLGTVAVAATVAAVSDEVTGMPRFVVRSLTRHARGDWGNLDPRDQAENDWAAVHNGRLVSVYRLPAELARAAGKETLLIITEADRSSTYILWPRDC